MKAGEMLDHAASMVTGERASTYGPISENFDRASRLFNIWSGDNILSPYDVARVMVCVKMARLTHTPGHADSHVDIAGYAAILEELANG